jgi:hypothetical protein
LIQESQVINMSSRLPAIWHNGHAIHDELILNCVFWDVNCHADAAVGALSHLRQQQQQQRQCLGECQMLSLIQAEFLRVVLTY